MKRYPTVLAIIATSVAAYFGFRPPSVQPAAVIPAPLHEGAPSTKADPAPSPEGIMAAAMEPAEVFKRALWRHPAPDDKILHGERREWTKDSVNGIARWQWFLEIEPGMNLKAWLREQNPFSVHPVASTSVPPVAGAPAGFPNDFSGDIVHTGGSRESLVFLFSRKGNTFYATSSGTGFSPGIPATATGGSTPPAVAQGRLPKIPPPASPKP